MDSYYSPNPDFLPIVVTLILGVGVLVLIVILQASKIEGLNKKIDMLTDIAKRKGK